jgi:3-phosphoshikimate 1-carboxyvinyltransferase
MWRNAPAPAPPAKGRMFSTEFLDLPPLDRRPWRGRAAGLQEHFKPRAAAGRPEPPAHGRCMTCWIPTTRASCSTPCAQLGCRRRAIQGSTAVAVTGLGGPGGRTRTARLFLGNAGTAMRPLAAGPGRSRAASSSSRACARMHERPIGDLVDAFRAARLHASTCTVRGRAIPPLKHPPARELRLDAPDPGARRCLQPVPHRPAHGPAAGGASCPHARRGGT